MTSHEDHRIVNPIIENSNSFFRLALINAHCECLGASHLGGDMKKIVK